MEKILCKNWREKKGGQPLTTGGVEAQGGWELGRSNEQSWPGGWEKKNNKENKKAGNAEEEGLRLTTNVKMKEKKNKKKLRPWKDLGKTWAVTENGRRGRKTGPTLLGGQTRVAKKKNGKRAPSATREAKPFDATRGTAWGKRGVVRVGGEKWCLLNQEGGWVSFFRKKR